MRSTKQTLAVPLGMMFSGICFFKPVKGPWGILTELISPISHFNLCPVCSQHSYIIQNPQTLHNAWKSIAILVMTTSLLACPLLPSVSRSPDQSPFLREHPEYLLEKAIQGLQMRRHMAERVSRRKDMNAGCGMERAHIWTHTYIWHAILSHSFDPYHPLQSTVLEKSLFRNQAVNLWFLPHSRFRVRTPD